MSPATSADEILTGIKAYLRTHFPDIEFTVKDDPKTHSVVLHSDGRPHYRLEVTERFLDADDGVAKSLGRLHEWEVAKVLRDARSKLVTLATTGLHTAGRHLWTAAPTRRRT
jgi:hypothetical protein